VPAPFGTDTASEDRGSLVLLEQLAGVSGGVIRFLLTPGADGVWKLGPVRMHLQRWLGALGQPDGAWSSLASGLTCFFSRDPGLKGHQI